MSVIEYTFTKISFIAFLRQLWELHEIAVLLLVVAAQIWLVAPGLVITHLRPRVVPFYTPDMRTSGVLDLSLDALHLFCICLVCRWLLDVEFDVVSRILLALCVSVNMVESVTAVAQLVEECQAAPPGVDWRDNVFQRWSLDLRYGVLMVHSAVRL